VWTPLSFSANDSARIIAALLPDVLVKGGDWAGDQIIGREEVEAAWARRSIPSFPDIPTTAILAKMRACGSPSGKGIHKAIR